MRPGPYCRGCLIFTASLALIAGGNAVSSDDEPYRDYVIRRVSEALARRASASVVERVEGAGDAALYADNLKKEGVDEGFVRLASKQLRAWLEAEEEPWVRHLLLEALGKIDVEAESDYISGFIDHADPTLRARAAAYLGEVLTEELEARLVKRYPVEPFWWVKTELIGALAQGSTDASLEVLHLALRDSSRDIRAAASEALGSRADARSAGPLIAAMEDSGLVGTDSPVWALGALGGSAVVTALEKAASSTYPIVRKGAAWALGRAGEPSSEPVLARLLHDPDWMIRVEAAEALGELGGVPAALDLLDVLLGDPNERLFSALLLIPKPELLEGCRLFPAEPLDVPAGAKITRTELCRLVEKRAGGERVYFWSSGELHSTFYSPFNANAREVWPKRGRSTIGWEDVVGADNGGKRSVLKKGTELTIWKASYYRGETWLEVAAGPYDRFWVRESDVRPIDPGSLRREDIYKNYGADTTIRGFGKAGDSR